MKIVQINAVYGFASTGRTTREMHEYLMAHGIESYVFCASTLKHEKNVMLMGSKVDHKLHSAGSHFLGLEGYFSHIPTLILLKKLDKIQPDAVILRNLHSHYVNVPMLLKYLAKRNITTIVVLHDVWTFTGLCCYYTEDKCDGWKSGCGNCRFCKKNGSLIFDRTAKVYQDKEILFGNLSRLGIIGVSKWVANEGRQSSIFKNAKYFGYIYNWIDSEVFYPKDISLLRLKLKLSENDFVVLGVAQYWSEKKGYSQYFDLASNCKDIKVVLVGKNVSEDKVPDNMICVPPTNNINELADYYSMANVYLNLSIQETFGKVSAEALSCGTPIITFNSTANPELCGDGCGYVINIRDWKEAMPYVYEIKKRGKAAYIDKCVAFAKENFNKVQNIKQYLSLIEKLNG